VAFSSLEFIFRFFPAFLALYYLVAKKHRNKVLLIGSLCFYALGDIRYLPLIIVSILVNYLAVRQMIRYPNQEKIWLFVSLVYNIGTLFFFKYSNFLIENVNTILRLSHYEKDFPLLNLGLPLGISFYTFQIISCVVDVYRKEIKEELTFFRFATYVTMFPKILSGPITSYGEISDELTTRKYNIFKIEMGLRLFILGLGMKVLVADRIGMLWNDIQTIGFQSISTPLAWLGSMAYSIQIYLDFQGYSLMAIGIGRMLGFHLPNNFNHPYMSKSVTEFWRRWHMTLGMWFRSYVYIPLGGNRHGMKRLVANLFAVWILTGLWHGASWNFILWGFLLFLLILLEKLFYKPLLDRSRILARLYMLFVMPVSWMIFAINSSKDLTIYLGRMFGISHGINVNPYDYLRYLGQYKWMFLIGGFLCFPYGRRLFNRFQNSLACTIFLLFLFWYSVYLISNGINNPFLYFKF
jgi:alginate O-acetyltransferase complex protein AlgI